jgi:LPS O-antigen subunit length determinant protein (WzzB/FepE family)
VTNVSDEAVQAELSSDANSSLVEVIVDLEDDVVQALKARFGAAWKIEAARLLREAAL